MPPPQFEISVPTTSRIEPVSEKPYTNYNILIRLPLRSYNVSKRYSEFQTLDQNLQEQAGSSPPTSLPGKSWLPWNGTRTEAQIEARRIGLEAYLKDINSNIDRRWRTAPAWRAFLNLPSASFGGGDNPAGRAKTDLHRNITLEDQAITDPVLWLDVHRELKSQLQEARLALQRRDQALEGSNAGLEFSALAKKSLVLASKMVSMLENGLRISGSSNGGDEKGIGPGEVRRRKDLITAAQRECEGLEALANSYVSLRAVAAAAGSSSSSGGGYGRKETADRSALFGGGPTKRTGRVLGAPAQETNETRELDNEGVLQLQKQYVQKQDDTLRSLHQIVGRQRDLAVAINQELTIQNELLGILETDVDRVEGKLKVAKKKVDGIS